MWLDYWGGQRVCCPPPLSNYWGEGLAPLAPPLPTPMLLCINVFYSPFNTILLDMLEMSENRSSQLLYKPSLQQEEHVFLTCMWNGAHTQEAERPDRSVLLSARQKRPVNVCSNFHIDASFKFISYSYV